MRCGVCPRGCQLSEGERGFCHGRVMREGESRCANYGCATALALDPIEKKPLSFFMPGSMILSYGSYGCNMSCGFCQNHSISQHDLGGSSRRISPDELARTAAELLPQGNIGLAFTYNEPLIGWEFVADASRISRSMGMKNVLVTNGLASREVIERAFEFVDAANIDLKTYDPEGYRALGGDLETVMDTIAYAAERIHVEVTTLIVPGFNDSADMMRELARWLASLGDIPLHISRYFPNNRYTTPATSMSTMAELVHIVREYLPRVRAGNCVL